MRRPIVIIESPYAGDVEANVAYARRCLLDSINRGEAPLASHLLYTQVLNDKKKAHRKTGIECGYAFYYAADRIVFYMDQGMSPGMERALALCGAIGRRFELRRLGA